MAENLYNARLRSDNRSGIKGVYFCTTWRKWKVGIHAGGKKHCLGSYDTLSEAEAVARSFRERMHGERARHA